MTINKTLLNRKIKLISRDLKKIKQLSLLTRKEYFKNEDYEILSERYLERIIGRMIDINYHILSDFKDKAPDSYFESFLEMGENGFLPKKLAESLAQVSGLRNYLVHDDIDEEKIYLAIKTVSKEVPLYLKNILKIIEKNKNKLF